MKELFPILLFQQPDCLENLHFTCMFYLQPQDLLDSEKGYVKDDSVTLEVYVIADAPHGVR